MQTNFKPLNFQDLNKLPGVQSSGSNSDHDPYFDSSVTLYLTNNYRIISEKTLFGQGLTITPLETAGSEQKTEYVSLMRNELPVQGVPVNTTPTFFKYKGDTKTPITRAEFDEVINQVVGQEVKNFLADRHGFLSYRRF